MKDLRRVPELILWYRLLHSNMYGKLLRFYGTVWVVSGGIIVASLALLFQHNAKTSPSYYGPNWVWLLLCIASIIWGYGIGKVYGSTTINISAVLVPALVLIATEQGGNLNWSAFTKGIGISISLVVFTFVVYAIAPFPYSFVGYRGWPHRRAIAFVLLITGLLGLELLRLVIGMMPNLRLPWQSIVTSFMIESGWPYAICLWIWLNIAYILSNYDAELLPPLLRRIGLPDVPDQLSLEHAYMVEYLLAELPDRPDL